MRRWIVAVVAGGLLVAGTLLVRTAREAPEAAPRALDPAPAVAPDRPEVVPVLRLRKPRCILGEDSMGIMVGWKAVGKGSIDAPYPLPLVVVHRPDGTTERKKMPHPVDYMSPASSFLGGWGFEVRTEGDLDQALNAALANHDTFSLLNVHLDPLDVSPALNRLAKRVSKKI